MGKQFGNRTKRLFARVEGACRIKTTRFNKPGNRYRFIGWQKGKETYRVTWGVPDFTITAAYPETYKLFTTLLPTATSLNN